MNTLTWPDKTKINELNSIICETTLSPFGVSIYNPKEYITDFVGRQEELHRFREQLLIVLQNQKSRIVRLEGPAGVGKSTLFNYLKQSIEQERASGKSTGIQFLLKDIDILSTYFNLPEQIADFSDLWKYMMENMSAGLEREIHADITFPEYIAYHILYKLLSIDFGPVSSLIWEKDNCPEDIHFVQIADLIPPIRNGKPKIPQIINYWNSNREKIRTQLRYKNGSTIFEFNRRDFLKIQELFQLLDDTHYSQLVAIQEGKSDAFKSSDDMIQYFNDLAKYYACSTQKRPLFLIGIDEFAKSEPSTRTEYYQQLANLMVRIRNQLDYVLFVYLSTSEDWRNYDSVIESKSDLKAQIAGFTEQMQLAPLKTEEVIQVFRNRMHRFWSNYSSVQSPIAPYYPFSDKAFEYVYHKNRRRLRESIHDLCDLWTSFRLTHEIPKLESLFDVMRTTYQLEKKAFNAQTLQPFEWESIAREFNRSDQFSTKGQRSTAIEIGIENAWKCLKQGQFMEITDVQNNPVIHTSTQKRRPDVYITIHGNRSAEFRRNVEFQIKAYQADSSVGLNEIESSLELFTEQHTDFIYFLITGKGFSSEAEAKVKEIEKEFFSRIRRPPLNNTQINAMYVLALYEEITNAKMGSTPADEANAKYLLEIIINQSIEEFLKEIQALSFRISTNTPQYTLSSKENGLPPSSIITRISDNKPEMVSSIIDSNSQSDPNISTPSNTIKFSPTNPIKSTPPITISTPSLPAIKPSNQSQLLHPVHANPTQWLTTYPIFQPTRFELCALGQYLATREKTANKNKFTVNTVEKNVIIANPQLDKTKFKALIKVLASNEFISLEKTTYCLTTKGETLYHVLKSNNFSC